MRIRIRILVTAGLFILGCGSGASTLVPTTEPAPTPVPTFTSLPAATTTSLETSPPVPGAISSELIRARISDPAIMGGGFSNYQDLGGQEWGRNDLPPWPKDGSRRDFPNGAERWTNLGSRASETYVYDVAGRSTADFIFVVFYSPINPDMSEFYKRGAVILGALGYTESEARLTLANMASELDSNGEFAEVTKETGPNP